MTLHLLAYLTLRPAHASSPDEVANPRAVGAWVADQAEVLDAAAEGRLAIQAEALRTRTGVEAAVVTIEDASIPPRDFAAALFTSWGLGAPERDDGLLLLYVAAGHRTEVHAGYGLAVLLPESWLGELRARMLAPLLRGGEVGAALQAQLAAIAQRIPDGGVPAPAGPRGWVGALPIALAAGSLGTLAAWGLASRRRGHAADHDG